MENITLHSTWFELVLSGEKIYEGRRNTDKIKNIKIGQIIKIQRRINKNIIDYLTEPYYVTVEDKLYFKTFEDALKILPIKEVLPIDDITVEKGVDIYKQYVSLETQFKDGIVMLKIKTIK